MSLPKDQAWFPAKTYGYGWGLPSRWQGWVVTAVYLLAIFCGMALLPEHPGWYFAHLAVASGALVGICIWKGEPPRWQWGEEDSS